MREPQFPSGRSVAPLSSTFRLPLPGGASLSGRGRRTARMLGAAAMLLAGTAAAAPQDTETSTPWRLADALDTPEWFEISGTIRGRFETFDEQFRGGAGGNEHIWVTRSIVNATVRDRFLSATAELMDSRVFDGVSDARLNTGVVNAAELLQAYVAADFTDTFQSGDQLRVLAGRHTMNIGSRRLVARNRFRNTINAFTGVNALWKGKEGSQVRAFYTHPVQRLPGGQSVLEDNEIRADEERVQARFFGVHAAKPDFALGMDAELYAFGLDEKDSPTFNSRDRDLTTVGTRWQRQRDAGELHWELESVYQFGESRESTSAGRTLDHSAQFHHLIVGYSLEDEHKTRVEGLFDYVTGDNRPGDGVNSRFDTLFGARRFEFGPTGIFGAFARSNLVSPGLRLVTKPAPNWELMVAHRFHYLASDRDAWTTAGLRDATGASGDHIGNFTEFRVRYDWIPKSVRIEFGAAYFAAGTFVDETAANGGRDSVYGYLQTNFTF